MTRAITVLDRSTVQHSRFKELDGLRGIAAFLVVIYHFGPSFNQYFFGHPAAPYDFGFGEFGVQLFFMISGYVILMSAVRGGSAAGFAVSRFSRLYPTYWLALFVSVLIFTLYGVDGRSITWLQALVNTTMFQRFMFVDNVDQVYWTLAIELQFYALMFVGLLLYQGKITTRVVRAVVITWLMVAIAVSISVAVAGPTSQVPRLLTWMVLGEHGPLFSIGIVAFLSNVERRFDWLLPVSIAVAVGTAWLQHDFEYAVQVAIMVALFVVVIAVRDIPLLRRGPVHFLGRISYPLYVLHVLPGFLVLDLVEPAWGPWWSRILALAVVLALSWLVHRTVEGPVSSWLRRSLTSLVDAARRRRDEKLRPVNMSTPTLRNATEGRLEA